MLIASSAALSRRVGRSGRSYQDDTVPPLPRTASSASGLTYFDSPRTCYAARRSSGLLKRQPEMHGMPLAPAVDIQRRRPAAGSATHDGDLQGQGNRALKNRRRHRERSWSACCALHGSEARRRAYEHATVARVKDQPMSMG